MIRMREWMGAVLVGLAMAGTARAGDTQVRAIRTIAAVPAETRTLSFDAAMAGARASAPVLKNAKTAMRRPALLPEDDPATRRCVEAAVEAFGIESYAMYLILDVEGGSVGEVSAPNKNGSYDIGPAQVNSDHVPLFASRGISEAELRDNLCVNILAGAWLYKDARRRASNVAKAIAIYHSPTEKYQRIYLERVYEAIERRERRMALATTTGTH